MLKEIVGLFPGFLSFGFIGAGIALLVLLVLARPRGQGLIFIIPYTALSLAVLAGGFLLEKSKLTQLNTSSTPEENCTTKEGKKGRVLLTIDVRNRDGSSTGPTDTSIRGENELLISQEPFSYVSSRTSTWEEKHWSASWTCLTEQNP